MGGQAVFKEQWDKWRVISSSYCNYPQCCQDSFCTHCKLIDFSGNIRAEELDIYNTHSHTCQHSSFYSEAITRHPSVLLFLPVNWRNLHGPKILWIIIHRLYFTSAKLSYCLWNTIYTQPTHYIQFSVTTTWQPTTLFKRRVHTCSLHRPTVRAVVKMSGQDGIPTKITKKNCFHFLSAGSHTCILQDRSKYNSTLVTCHNGLSHTKTKVLV